MDQVQKTNEWVENIISFWNERKIKLEVGASLKEISEVEYFIGIHFPYTFVELYKKANGFRGNDWNTSMFSIWPLQRIKEKYRINNDTNFIGFCDYLINSHIIGFSKTKVGIFKDHDPLNPVALTFEESIELIIYNSDLIY